MCEVDGVVVVITWANRRALIISYMLRPEWKCGMNREEKRRLFRNLTLTLSVPVARGYISLLRIQQVYG